MPGARTYFEIIEQEICGIRTAYENDMIPSAARFDRIDECLRILQGKPYRPPNKIMVVPQNDPAFDVVG